MKPVVVGSEIIPMRPPAEYVGSVWRVDRIFDDGATLLLPVGAKAKGHGAYLAYDLTGFTFRDGGPIEQHPAVPCDFFIAGCWRNPLGVCVRCGGV